MCIVEYPNVLFRIPLSMVIPEVEEQLRQLNIENVVLMGIEVSTTDYDKYSTPPFTLHDIVL